MFFTAVLLSLTKVASSFVIGTGVVPIGCGPACEIGTWSEWSEWTTCTTALTVTSQSRFRTCSMTSCAGGSYSEARPCTIMVPPPALQPQWSNWGPWSSCSASCGGGVSYRVRLCKDPCNTCCVGVATESSTCNTQPCCEWSSWSPWSQCSVTCGTGGTTYRTRQCSCVEGCAGPSQEQISCDADIPCPEIPPPMPILPPP
ncbi:unnamed protein product, partial [Cylicostephanus goldi]